MNDENQKQFVNRTQRQQKAALIGAITQHYENKYRPKTNQVFFLFCWNIVYYVYFVVFYHFSRWIKIIIKNVTAITMIHNIQSTN